MENETKENIEKESGPGFRGRNRHNQYLTGLVLILIGAALLVDRMGVPLPYWLFTWPMLLIVIGLYSGIKHSFRNSAWIILIAIGSFFLVDDFIPELRLQPLFWPVVIIGLGVLFIIKPRRRERDWRFDWNNDKGRFGRKKDTPFYTPGQETVSDSNDYFNIHSVFSGVKRNVLSKNFKGGSISCVFGGVEIDLTQADFTGKAVIRMEEVFGGTKLVIPADWVVLNEIEGIFHGVEDKRNYHATVAAGPNKVLILRGSAVFAGIEIRSY